MPLSAAEKQRRYRQRRDADPERREAYLEKEKEKWRKDRDTGKKLSVSELNDRERRAKRLNWRAAQVKCRTAKAASAAAIDQCMTPPLSPEPEPTPGPSRLELEEREVMAYGLFECVTCISLYINDNLILSTTV